MFGIKTRKRRNRADDRVEYLQDDAKRFSDSMNTRMEETLGKSPQATSTFRAGQGILSGIMRDQTRNDAATAASRGLAGGEFEIAQAANRAKTTGEFLRNLFAQSDTSLRQDRQSAIQQAMQARNMLNNLSMGRLNMLNDQVAKNNQALSNAVSNGVAAFAGGK